MTEEENRNRILLLRRSGWSLVVRIQAKAAATSHYWALEHRKGRGGEWETTLVFKGSQQARSKGRARRWCTPLSPFDGFFMFNLWWHPAGHQHHSSLAHPGGSRHWHVRSWISGRTITFGAEEQEGSRTTYPNSLIDQLAGLLQLLRGASDGEDAHVGVGVGRWVSLELHVGTWLLFDVLDGFSTCKRIKLKKGYGCSRSLSCVRNLFVRLFLNCQNVKMSNCNWQMHKNKMVCLAKYHSGTLGPAMQHLSSL